MGGVVEVVMNWVSLAVSAVSLLGLVWTLAVKLTRIESSAVADRARIDLMWKLYVEDAAAASVKRGLFDRQSELRISKKLACIMVKKPDPALMRIFVDMVDGDLPEEEHNLHHAVVQRIGLDRVVERATVYGLTPTDYIAYWSVGLRRAKEIGVAEFFAELKNLAEEP